jgi:hypothetical protein
MRASSASAWSTIDTEGTIEDVCVLPNEDGDDVFFVVNLFGFRNEDGTRRFTMALLAVARKNAAPFEQANDMGNGTSHKVRG